MVYAFPPFAIISKVLSKIKQDKTTAVIIVPYWANQPWFSYIFKMCIDTPCVLPSSRNLLLLPQEPSRTHHLWQRLKLIACLVSGNLSKVTDYRIKLSKFLREDGGQESQKDTHHTSGNFPYFAHRGRKIFLKRL